MTTMHDHEHHHHEHHHHEHHHHEHHHGEHHHETRLPPSGTATVVLDIGDGVGALVVHAPAVLCGVEIELARSGSSEAVTHTEVRERRLPEGPVFAGVFSALTAGDYRLLAVDGQPARDLTIRSGRVTEVAITAPATRSRNGSASTTPVSSAGRGLHA